MIIDGFEHGRPYTHAYTPTHWGIIMALSDHSWVQDEQEGGGRGKGGSKKTKALGFFQQHIFPIIFVHVNYKKNSAQSELI